MRQTKEFKRRAFRVNLKLMMSTLLLLIAMLVPQAAWAATHYDAGYGSTEISHSAQGIKFKVVYLRMYNYQGNNSHFYSNPAVTVTADGHTHTFNLGSLTSESGKNTFYYGGEGTEDKYKGSGSFNRVTYQQTQDGIPVKAYFDNQRNDKSVTGDDNGGSSKWCTADLTIEIDVQTAATVTIAGNWGDYSDGINKTEPYSWTFNIPKHTCNSDSQITTQTYFATPADCEHAATYYKSCSWCGAAQSGTFSSTDAKDKALKHDYNNDGICNHDNSHYQPATTSGGYYLISNYGQLCWFRDFAKSSAANASAKAKLTADITLSGKTWATSIGEGIAFSGIFDGQGHTITGNARKALFCVLAAGGTVKNLVAHGGSSKDDYENAAYQSPFVRRNYGTIENCIVKSAYWDSRNSYLGGITGVNETGGIVRNCGFYDSTLRLRNSANTQVGGIVGVNCENGRVENCFTWGINYYNIGSLGSGGIVCENRSGAIVSNCYTNAATPVFKQEGTATNLTSGISAAFITTGEMCHKLNGGITNGTQTWYQKIGTETFPNPAVKATTNTVYQIAYYKCDGKTLSTTNFTYSNNASAQRAKEGHGSAEYTPTYNWGGNHAYASCTFTLTCNLCGTNVVSNQPLTPSKVEAEHKDAKCTEKGKEQYTVAAGMYSKTGDVSYTGSAQTNDYAIPALGHIYGAGVWSWKWTDEEKSATCTRTCQRDGCTDKTPGHTASATVTLNNGIDGEETQHATCTEKGITTYTATATVEDAEYTDTKEVADIQELGHSYGAGAWSWADDGHSATCTRTCTRSTGCTDDTPGHTASVTVTVGNGITGEKTQPATCTTKGITTYSATAIVEDAEYTDTKEVADIQELGHDYGEGVWAWTWTDEEHSATYTCSCTRGTGCTDDTPGHTASVTVTVGNGITGEETQHATCTAKGITTYTATAIVENAEYTDTKEVADIEMRAHVFTVKSTDEAYRDSYDVPCQDDTYFFKCASCDAHGTDVWTKTGTAKHTYGDDHLCTNCDAKDPGIASGTQGECSWIIYSDGELVISPTYGDAGSLDTWSDPSWYSYRYSIKTVHFEGKVSAVTAYRMFYECSNLTSIDLSNFNTDNVTDMYGMFYNCSSLTELDLSNFNTANVTNMYGMFFNCSSLTELDLSNFNTANVTDFKLMLERCDNLTKLTVGNFDMSKAETYSSMTSDNHKSNTLIFKSVPYIKEKAFYEFGSYYGLKMICELDEKSVIYKGENPGFPVESSVLTSTLTVPCSLDLTGSVLENYNFTTKNITHSSFDDNHLCVHCGAKDPGIASGTQGECSWIIYSDGELVISPTNGDAGSLGQWEEAPSWYDEGELVKAVRFEGNVSAETARNLFSNCDSLVSVDFGNLSTANVTDMNGMFAECPSLTSVDLSKLNTANVTDMGNMFYNCSSLTSLDLSNFNTENVTDMNSMFNNCSSLTSLDLSKLNTENVTDMGKMFCDCSSLTALNLSNFNTANVAGMGSMFHNCASLTSLDVSNFDVANVSNMISMFSYCSSLTSLDLSTWKPGDVDISNMFDKCSSLTTLTIGNFDMTNVYTIWGKPFYNCDKLNTLILKSIPYLDYRIFYNQFTGEGKRVICELDEKSVIYKGENPYYPTITSVTAPCSLDLTGSVVENHPNLTLTHSFDAARYEMALAQNGYYHKCLVCDGCHETKEDAQIDFCRMFGEYYNAAEKQSVTLPLAKVGSYYYTSLYTDFPYRLSEGVSAYQVNLNGDGKLKVFERDDFGAIDANSGVILRSESMSECTITYDPEGDHNNTDIDAVLVGTTVDITDPASNMYAFSLSDTGYIGFWRWPGMTIPAWKAYLQLPVGSNPKGMRLVFDDEPDAIEQVRDDASPSPFSYDMMGHRVNDVKGFGIVNGEKVMVK